MSLYAGDHDSRNIIAERDMYKAQCATQTAQIEALTGLLNEVLRADEAARVGDGYNWSALLGRIRAALAAVGEKKP